MGKPAPRGSADLSVLAFALFFTLLCCGMRRRLWLGTVLWLALLASAHAHLMPAGQGTVNVVGNRAYLVISFPVSAWPGLDANADGFASGTELQAGDAAVRSQFKAGVTLASQGVAARWVEVMPSLPTVVEHNGEPSPDVIVMAIAEFAMPPMELALSATLWGAPEHAVKVEGSVSANGQTLRQERGLISAQHPSYTFFAPPAQVVSSFFQHGFDHILSGWDHVLFLLALLAMRLSVRRWVLLLTTFTLAHGCTYAATVLGWVNAPAAWVEPLIAASIVLVATLHLCRVALKPATEAGLVWGVGLVHGLGFASAMGDQGLHSSYPGLGILGFNLGVEAGQMTVAAAILACVMAIRRWPMGLKEGAGQRAASGFAGVLGAGMLAQRLYLLWAG